MDCHRVSDDASYSYIVCVIYFWRQIRESEFLQREIFKKRKEEKKKIKFLKGFEKFQKYIFLVHTTTTKTSKFNDDYLRDAISVPLVVSF